MNESIFFKTRRIDNHEILLRSHDGGRTWNSSAKNLLDTRHRLAETRDQLKRAWAKMDASDTRWGVDFPADRLTVGTAEGRDDD
jgi:hypothetical protein